MTNDNTVHETNNNTKKTVTLTIHNLTTQLLTLIRILQRIHNHKENQLCRIIITYVIRMQSLSAYTSKT